MKNSDSDYKAEDEGNSPFMQVPPPMKAKLGGNPKETSDSTSKK